MSFGRVAIPGWHKSATRAPSAVQAAATQLSREDSSFAGKTKRLRGCRFSQGRRHSAAAPSGTSGVKEETASGWHDVLGSGKARSRSSEPWFLVAAFRSLRSARQKTGTGLSAPRTPEWTVRFAGYRASELRVAVGA